MRPAEFTPEQIIDAGQELQAAGRNITGFALRQKVGGGNPSRLKQVWDEHVSSQAVTKAEPVAELPVEVAEEVAAVTKALTERLAALAVELERLNPGFTERAEVGSIGVAPDADATVEDTATFRYLDCPRCGGILKPDIVYFGDSVPKDRVQQAYGLVDDADALVEHYEHP